MRVFIGIQFKSEVKAYLSDLQAVIMENSLKGNFTLHDNFHLTLRFIGDVSQKEIDTLSDVLDDVSKKVHPFNIKIGGLNSFPRKDKHIVFVEVIKNKTELKQLSEKIDHLLTEEGFEARLETYKPHITLGREVVLPQVSVLSQITSFQEEITVDRISLMLSHREQGRLVYTPIYEVELSK